MSPITFNWKYVTGLKVSQSAVRKYRDDDLGVVKEIVHYAADNRVESLYYVPGDSYTFTKEEDLAKRIQELQIKNQHGKVTLLRNTGNQQHRPELH